MLSRILYLLPNPIERAQVDSALPHIEFQIHKTRLALANAAENYFSAEARVSHSLETLGHALRDHPWLLKLLPQSVVEKIKLGGVVAYGVAQLAPGDFASQSTQLLASSTNLGAEADKAQRMGLLDDRPVSFHVIESSQRAPITSLADIGSRLDEVNEARKQIRVETYLSKTGQRTLLVYLPGTQSLLPVAGENPFDLTSDTQLTTDPHHSQLLKAIRIALGESGAKGSKVIFAGYSLGGIAAAQLAAQGGFDVGGVVTIGSPVGQVHLPTNVPVLSIQHNNDPIPSATGTVNPLTENWATVSREAKLPLGSPALSAHDLDKYCETLGLVDKTQLTGVSRVRQMIMSQLIGSKLETTKTFEFDR